MYFGVFHCIELDCTASSPVALLQYLIHNSFVSHSVLYFLIHRCIALFPILLNSVVCYFYCFALYEISCDLAEFRFYYCTTFNAILFSCTALHCTHIVFHLIMLHCIRIVLHFLLLGCVVFVLVVGAQTSCHHCWLFILESDAWYLPSHWATIAGSNLIISSSNRSEPDNLFSWVSDSNKFKLVLHLFDWKRRYLAVLPPSFQIRFPTESGGQTPATSEPSPWMPHWFLKRFQRNV